MLLHLLLYSSYPSIHSGALFPYLLYSTLSASFFFSRRARRVERCARRSARAVASLSRWRGVRKRQRKRRWGGRRTVRAGVRGRVDVGRGGRVEGERGRKRLEKRRKTLEERLLWRFTCSPHLLSAPPLLTSQRLSPRTHLSSPAPPPSQLPSPPSQPLAAPLSTSSIARNGRGGLLSLGTLRWAGRVGSGPSCLGGLVEGREEGGRGGG